ncbi:pyridoxamine kinase [Streptococcus sp. 27098_8_74]|uniref:pyridoxamine kinase n=1 Tax=Streptococcus sp. 27098_8_74 TaxID=3003646 RepID=UPI00352C0ACD
MTKVIVANDLVGLGKVALTSSLPIMSACQTEVLPLPTVLLSSHTGDFNNIYVRDLTDDLKGFCKQWEYLDFKVDGLVSGYFKSEEELKLVGQLARDKELPLFVDPIMADNGRLYQGFDRHYVEAMKDFCQQADVIIPNLTEAALLTDTPYLEAGSYDKVTVEKLLRDLAKLGTRKVIVTGISFETDKIGLAYFDKETNETAYLMRKSYKSHFYGSGDLVTAVLASGYFHHLNLLKVANLALDFMDQVLSSTLASGRPLKYGLCYEPHIGYLFSGFNALLEEKNEK